MKKFLFVLFGVFVVIGAFAAGENVPTSKSYVDSKLGEKQDIIQENDGTTQVLTNTGTAGEYGAKGIYDANGEYVAQTQNLVDAATMNTAVQNAIDSEFQCVEWDNHGECLLLDIFGNNVPKSPNLFDVSKIPTTSMGGTGAIVNNGDGSITVTAAPMNSGISTTKRLKDLAPELVAGKEYRLIFETTGSAKIALLYCSGNNNALWYQSRSLLITDTLLNCILYFYAGGVNATATIKNIQITEGTTATPYVPYGNLYLPNGE